MRFLLLALVLVTGCVRTGPTSGVSAEAEQQLQAIGPAFNSQFELDGSSLSFDQDRQLDVRARSTAFATLPARDQTARAQEMARWLWENYGHEAGLKGIRIRAAREGEEPSASSQVYHFKKADLERLSASS